MRLSPDPPIEHRNRAKRAARLKAIVLARYPEPLGSDYSLVAESADWKLYRRHAGGASRSRPE